MKQPILLAFVGFVLIAVGLFLRRPTSSAPEAAPTRVQSQEERVEALAESSAGTAEAKPEAAVEKVKPFEPESRISTAEKNSLESMIHVIADNARDTRRMDALIEGLNRSGQKPFMAKDKNPYTGEMVIVRTRSPLPGTRYFHAQYYEGKDGKHFLQHMSFEFRPGPGAMDEAVRFVQSTIGAEGRPGLASDNFREWHLPNGYTVWIKKMEPEDLDPNDPFNSYSSSDVGTVRVVVEENPHDH